MAGPKPPDIPQDHNDKEKNGYKTHSSPQKTPSLELEKIPTNSASYKLNPVAVSLIPDPTFDYATAAEAFESSSDNPANGIDLRYGKIAASYKSAIDSPLIKGLFSTGEQWSGDTYAAIVQNFSSALQDLTNLQATADTMAKIVKSYHMTLSSTRSQLLYNEHAKKDKNAKGTVMRLTMPHAGGAMQQEKQDNVKLATNGGDLLDHYMIARNRIQFNTRMHGDAKKVALQNMEDSWAEFTRQIVTETYSPGMGSVAEYVPVVPGLGLHQPSTSIPTPKPTGAQTTQTPTGSNLNSGAPSSSSIPSTSSAYKPTTTTSYKPETNQLSTQTPSSSTSQTDLSDAAKTAASTASDSANDALSTAQNGLQQALTAAQQAASQALQTAQGSNMGGASRLPEGVLGLGPASQGGPGGGRSGAGALAGGGGSGGGNGKAPSLALSSRNGMETTATESVTKNLAAVAKTSQAGIGGQTGTGAGGAPASGSRGDGSGKEHKTNKMLRRVQNGVEIMGDADAIVAVIGAPDAESRDRTNPSEQT